MGGLAHAFPEFKDTNTNDLVSSSSDFRLLSEKFMAQERQILPEVEAEIGRKILEAEKQGYLKGLLEGEQRGIEKGRKDVEPVVTNLSQALEELERVKKEIFSQAEKAAVKLAIALAEKIIQQEIRCDVSIILRMAAAVLKDLNENQNVTLKLNPHDVGALRAMGYDLGNISSGGRRFVVKEDPMVEPGGFIVDTEMGELDGRITQQLDAAKELLLGESSEAVE